jgi:hypothetical protein
MSEMRQNDITILAGRSRRRRLRTKQKQIPNKKQTPNKEHTTNKYQTKSSKKTQDSTSLPQKWHKQIKHLKGAHRFNGGSGGHDAPELGAPLASRTWGPFLFRAVRLTHRLIGAQLARGISKTRLGLVAPASLYRAQGRGHTAAIKCQARSRSSSLLTSGMRRNGVQQ